MAIGNFSIGDSVVFLLGAGFSVDAASEAGNPLVSGRPARYLLMYELLDLCFGKDALPPNKSIEDLFQETIDIAKPQPLDTLYDLIMEADYYITPCLRRGGSHEDNAYLRFLRDFPKSPLLTFNYDSLPEILLAAERSWSPEDGYGVPVQFQPETRYGHSSLRPVLHLHGSLCVYTATFRTELRQGAELEMLRLNGKPRFLFDPDRLGYCFSPFERVPPAEPYTDVLNRVIAPVPNKADGLKGEFIATGYRQAVDLIRTADQIVTIGYSFNLNDYTSYKPLLAAVVDKTILLVAPNAVSLGERLSHEHPGTQWEAESFSFKEWGRNGYPGIHRGGFSV